MEQIETITASPTTLEKPRAVKIALWSALALVLLGAAYLYAVRGVAILYDLSSGIAGMLCI